jgi:hypothetical protein
MPMWSTFIDLEKAFNAIYLERVLKILKDRGVGPKLLRLIAKFWEMTELCCRVGGSYGQKYWAFHGVTQGGPLSLRLFNIMVDAIVREWLKQVIEAKATVDGVGLEIRKLLTCFCVDDGIIVSRNSKFLKECINKLVGLFDHVGLKTNTKKMEAMTLLQGSIRGYLTEDAYEWRLEGVAEEGLLRKIACDKCGAMLAEGSMRKYRASQHGVFNLYHPPAVTGKEEDDLIMCTVQTDWRGRYPYPAGCPCPSSHNFWELRRHFFFCHPRHRLECARRGILSKCGNCRMQTLEKAFFWGGMRTQRPAGS